MNSTVDAECASRFYRSYYLTRDANVGNGLKRRLPFRLIIANSLVQADHAFLYQILVIRVDQGIRTRLRPDKAFELLKNRLGCVFVALLRLCESIGKTVGWQPAA